MDKRRYAKETWTETCGPWATFTRARAICPDGKLRVVKLAMCADSFFSVPARLSYRNKTVAGFISFAADSGLSTDPEQWVRFTPTGKYKDIWKE